MPFLQKESRKEFEHKSLETLLEEVFITYNQDWHVNLQTEMLFDLAVC